MFVNYVQHVDCDPNSADDHSRNFISSWSNYLTFDNGYHTVHHEQPGVHWSRYRALHLARADRIHPTLNQNSIFGYCFKTYLAAPLSARFRSRAGASASRSRGAKA
jgi:fatty acid desaturase